MRESLKLLYYCAQQLLRKDARLLKRIKSEDLTVVLNLHQISPHQNPFWPPLAPRVFESLLEFLSKNFEVTTFRELSSSTSKKPKAILSFDDGYYNFLEYAVPILEKFRIAANMNIIPSCVLSGRPIWNVRLYDFLNAAPKSVIDEINIPGFDHRLSDERPVSKVKFGLKISTFLKNRPRIEREELMRGVENVMQKAEIPNTRMMNVDEVLQIAALHEIGVHSYSHESMGFEDVSFFKEDLSKCFNFFEERLMLPLEIYAFPNGSYRDEQIGILRNSGIKKVLLVGEDYARAENDVFSRFTIYGRTPREVQFQALGVNSRRNNWL